ncbi:hypothetical protein OsJ_24164 [Oryza sativa Japonica Group]|uniref:Uncharacterized protein n=1 Tax=Oryza sativa subsp. japonica TaxID=39947 RepID=A3BJI6_ORYSJ|nr:hypothetical protein OsJ_24164 [Oryza sativa Japonica Group]
MDQLTSSTVFWLTTAVAFLLINTVILRALQKRKSSPAAAAAAAPPPVVQGVGLVRFVRAMARDGPLEAIREQQAKLGSVFTASAPLGLFKVTFLIGSEVSSHFYVASYSEISMGRLYEFTVPIFGPGVLYGVDLETRKEQIRFNWDILKPRSLKASVGAMAEEVEMGRSGYGRSEARTGAGTDADRESVPAGKGVARESVPGKLCELFGELDNGLHLISGLLPYLPIPAHRRRDRARQRLGEIITEVIRLRRNSSRGAAGTDENNDDMLQCLINSRYKDGCAMTDAEIAGLVVALMFAGKHTSSGVSIWTGVHLLSNPNHLAAVVAEQDRLMASCPGRTDDYHRLDYDTVQEMRSLHCCVKEALRLHPPVAAVRQAYKHFTVQTKEDKEYTIPGGHMVVSTILVNHYLPHIYKGPSCV